MTKKCEHRWDKVDYDDMTLGDFETIEFPATCAKCGDTAREVWIFSCYVIDDKKKRSWSRRVGDE